MIYVCGFRDGNSVNVVAEYQQRFPSRRIPTRRVFTGVYRTLRDSGTITGVRIAVERDVNLLQPTGHVMHQQFNIPQLYVLPTLYLSVLYLSENNQRLVLLTA